MVWRNLEEQQDTIGTFVEDFVYLFYAILIHSALTSLPGVQDPQSHFWCAPQGGSRCFRQAHPPTASKTHQDAFVPLPLVAGNVIRCLTFPTSTQHSRVSPTKIIPSLSEQPWTVLRCLQCGESIICVPLVFQTTLWTHSRPWLFYFMCALRSRRQSAECTVDKNTSVSNLKQWNRRLTMWSLFQRKRKQIWHHVFMRTQHARVWFLRDKNLTLAGIKQKKTSWFTKMATGTWSVDYCCLPGSFAPRASSQLISSPAHPSAKFFHPHSDCFHSAFHVLLFNWKRTSRLLHLHAFHVTRPTVILHHSIPFGNFLTRPDTFGTILNHLRCPVD